jgi:uncharacterized protein (TIRG00374 family)
MKSANSDHLNLAGVSRGKTVFRFVLSWLLTLILFVVIVSKVKVSEVLLGLSRADIRYVTAAVLFSLLAHMLFSSARYREIAHAMGKRISFFEAVLIRMGCNPIKGIFPLKIGELAIAAYMKRKHDLSYPGGFFSIVIGYPFSLIVLLFFYSAGGIFYFPDIHRKIFFLFLLFAALMLALPLNLNQMVSLFIQWIGKFKKFSGEEENFLAQTRRPEQTRNMMLYSLGVEGFKLLIIYALLKSLDVNVSAAALLLFGSLTVMAVYLPFTYWGLGVRESAIIFLFSGQAPAEKLFAAGLMTTFIDGILPVLLGLFFVQPFVKVLFDANPGNGETGP